MDHIKLTNEKLSVEEAMTSVTSSNCGAVSLFVGTTRDCFDGKKVLCLEYEAYDSMARKALKKMCTEMRDKWKVVENIAIYHRLGVVPVKESSVIIAISSPHRTDALEATQWCIDTLKKTVPIWKKEIYEESKPEWKENTECIWSKKIMNNKNSIVLPKVENSDTPSHLIQITCTGRELTKRIQTFMDRKQEQANLTNIQDFCVARQGEDSCARIDAVIIKQKNSKSHLKVGRVFNTYGSQNSKTISQDKSQFSNAIGERLEDLECNLNIIKPVNKNIYDRLKLIEERVQYLESISPEYANFWNKTSIFQEFEPSEKGVKKRKYSVEEIDKLLLNFERNV